MPKLPGVNHLKVVAAFEKAGFRILLQGAHIVSGRRQNSHHSSSQSVNAYTMGGIVRDSGLSVEEFRKLL